MITQIYETQSADEARELIKIGVDHIGVLVGKGEFPREKSIDETIAIFGGVSGDAKKVALPLSEDMDYIKMMIEKVRPDIVQIGTLLNKLSPDQVRELKTAFPNVAMMRVIPVTGPESVAAAKSYDGIADWLLLDTMGNDGRIIGATGRTHDWNISKQIVDSVNIPVILAGGLGPDNVAEAIQKVRPAGVDCKTKTDMAGTAYKDLEKVGTFVRAADAAA